MCASEPGVDEPPRSAAGAWLPGEFGAVLALVLPAPDQEPLTVLPCCVACPPACGPNRVLPAEECSTVVVSGWDAAWEVAAELTGVVVTGWLATALPVVRAAALATPVPAFTGWLSEEENDGDRPLDPLAGRFAGPEENGPAEY
ncbi:MAG: hypothetical protein ACRDSH_14800, partial [Pseudonocardiaceae bacterium]